MFSPVQDRNSQRAATQRALLAAPEPSTTRPPILIERLEPPSQDPNVTMINDGPMPNTRDLAIEAADHDRMMDARMETLLRGVEDDMREMRNDMMDPADLPRQDPAAAAEAPAPIPVSVEPEPEPVTPTVEPEELRPCSTCLRRCPPTDFVGVTGQRTRSTCNACCVGIQRIPSTLMAADSLLASRAGAASGRE